MAIDWADGTGSKRITTMHDQISTHRQVGTLTWYIWMEVMRVHRPCLMMSTVPLMDGSLLVNGAATLASPI